MEERIEELKRQRDVLILALRFTDDPGEQARIKLEIDGVEEEIINILYE